MLIVDINTLDTVCLLNFSDKIIVYCVYAEDFKYIVRVESTLCKKITLLDDVAFFNFESEAVRNEICSLICIFLRSDNNMFTLLDFSE